MFIFLVELISQIERKNNPRKAVGHRIVEETQVIVALRMLHAVMHEVPDIERIGEIVEIGQRVRNLELSRFFRHFSLALEHQ